MSRAKILSLATLAAISSGVVAQTRATSQLRVHVTDPTGAVVRGANVTLVNQDTNLKRSASTDANGNADFAGLPLTGHYAVTVEAESFARTQQQGLTLDADALAQANVRLAVGAEQATVNVTDTDNTIQTASAQLGVRFDANEMNLVPLPNRKLSTIPLLDSSVRAARGTGDLFLGQTLFVIDGGGRRQTTFAVDDTTGDDIWGRQSLFTTIPLSAVQEFSVQRNALSAEYGRTSGNAVNIVTKSGTNTLHGDFIGVWRPTQLEANNPLSVQHTGDKLVQGSGTLSGPIARDRTYFMVSEEYSQDDRGSYIQSPLAAANPVFIGHQTQELFTGRVDQRIGERHQLSLRAGLDQLKDTNPQDAVGALSLPSTARTFRRNTYSTALSLNSALSASTVNDARVQFQLGSPITQFVPVNYSTQFSYPGYATVGNSQYASLINHQYEAADTLTRIFGRHTVKFGADYIRSSNGGFGQEFGGGFLAGQFTMKAGVTADPSQLTAANITRFQQTFGNQQYHIIDDLGGVFVQDNWRAMQNLTLELGLRYDIDAFTDARANLGPRIGVSYRVPDSKTVVRASYGMFYSEERTDLAASDKIFGPQGEYTFSAAPGQFGFPTTLTALPALPAGAVLPARDIWVRAGQCGYLNQFLDVSKLHSCPNALLNPYTEQWTASVEQDFGGGWLFTADYLGQITRRIERPVDLNAPAPFIRTAPGQVRSATVADATRQITPVPGGYKRVLAYVNQGEAAYNGLQLDLRKRLSKRFTTLVSYTWSHTINNVETDAPSQDPNDYNLLDDYEKASSLLDQRHRLSVSGTVELPLGMEFSTWIQAASGRPYNVTTGADNNGDGSTADRPVINGVVIPRNYGMGAPTYNISAYVAKNFHVTERYSLSLRGEGYNLTNHLNVVGYNGVYGNGVMPSGSFGQPLAGVANTEPARQFEFEARFTF